MITFALYLIQPDNSVEAECLHCALRPLGTPNNSSDGARISKFDVIGGFGAGRFFLRNVRVFTGSICCLMIFCLKKI